MEEERLWKVQETKKKVKTKKKICGKILFLIFMLLVLFAMNTIRKYCILKQYTELYEDCENYKGISYTYKGDSVSIVETYYKQGKTLSTYKDNDKKSVFYENQLTNTSIMKNDVNGIKTAKIDENNKIIPIKAKINKNEIFFTKNDFWTNAYIAAGLKISTKKCNGRNCYLIEYPLSSTSVYIDKENFLLTRVENGETYINDNIKVTRVTDYFWEIGTVKDSQVEKPDLDGYEIK